MNYPEPYYQVRKTDKGWEIRQGNPLKPETHRIVALVFDSHLADVICTLLNQRP